jgi:hypothetical protein
MSTQQTAEKIQSNQCHHLQQSQNATLCWPDVQKRLFHQRKDDKIQNPCRLGQGMGNTLTHFMDLYALRKAYGNNRAANSGFESAAHIQENSLGHSVITTESSLTRNLYIESLEESLAVAQEYVTKDMAAQAAPPPANEQLTLLCNDLNAQRKQFKLVMEQNSKLLAALSKGGGGG